MKNRFLLASFVGLMVCFSCKKQATEPIIVPEQTVFENLTTCCQLCTKPVSLKNVTGKLLITGYSLDGKPGITAVIPDSAFNISDKQLPMFKYYGNVFYLCNLPDKIRNIGSERRVKFDCNLIYLDVPSGGQIPQTDGYPVDLIRIEVLN